MRYTVGDTTYSAALEDHSITRDALQEWLDYHVLPALGFEKRDEENE